MIRGGLLKFPQAVNGSTFCVPIAFDKYLNDSSCLSQYILFSLSDHCVISHWKLINNWDCLYYIVDGSEWLVGRKEKKRS